MGKIHIQEGLFLGTNREQVDRGAKIFLHSAIHKHFIYKYIDVYLDDKPILRCKEIALFFYAFLRNYATRSVKKNPKTSIFYLAHHELSIDMKYITIALLEPNFLKEAQKRGFFYSFSGFTGLEVAGSD